MSDHYKDRFRDIEEVRKNWGWFFALGALLLVFGLTIMGFAFILSFYYSTGFPVILLGIFLMAAGIVQIVQAFLASRWKGLFLSLALGILYVVTGFFCISNPVSTGMQLTVWIAAFFGFIGLFRMIAALYLKFESWGWVFFNGFVSFILGIMIYSSWPIAGLWVIGMFVGIDMILSGWSWILLSWGANPKSAP
jgi:uncharacterized membrane protein HdeD (DUF308 family)